MTMGWGILLALVLSFVIFGILFHVLKKVTALVLNGILGIVLFWLLNYVGILHVPIDVITFLIAAFGGALGVIIVIIFTFLGVPL